MPANTKQQQQPVVLKIEFSNRKAMEHFARWLSGSGEQEYWTWMECRELDEPDSENITATEFKYYGDLDYLPSDYSEFVGDDTIRTTCGRLDKRHNDK